MPGLIKIGLTKRDELEARLNELYSTGVPLPFTCEYACRVKDCKAVENALHTAFTKDRINPAREFFRTSVEYVKPILELLKGYNKSAVEKYLKFYENKERYFECKGTAKNSGKKQFRFQMRLDQRRQHSSWA